MSLACGIVGLPNVGKSTLFNALTAAGAKSANFPFCTIEPNVGIVELKDPRLDVLARHVPTERVVRAAVKVVDIAGLVKGASEGEGLGNKFLANIKECDAILHVVRCFRDAGIVHVAGGVDPAADMAVVELELALADLETVARAADRVGRKAKSGEKDAREEHATLEKAKAALERGEMLRLVDWKTAELAVLAPLCLLTMKPVLFVANVGPDDLAGTSDLVAAVRRHARDMRAEVVTLCGDIEGDLASLPEADATALLRELGLEAPGLERLARAAHALLGLQTFFTAGPKEIRAWTIHAGDRGPAAAGVIHSDFEKNYIRAEIYSVEDITAHGSESAIRAAGKLRVEGRDYVMREGDVAHFLVGC